MLSLTGGPLHWHEPALHYIHLENSRLGCTFTSRTSCWCNSSLPQLVVIFRLYLPCLPADKGDCRSAANRLSQVVLLSCSSCSGILSDAKLLPRMQLLVTTLFKSASFLFQANINRTGYGSNRRVQSAMYHTEPRRLSFYMLSSRIFKLIMLRNLVGFEARVRYDDSEPDLNRLYTNWIG